MSTSTEIPKVTGRHRNRALAAERRRRAVGLALVGVTYQAIADELGYANRGTVYRIVQEALRAREAQDVDELRHLEVARLDAIQRTFWGPALSGDASAAAVVLRVLDRRCRLLGLYGGIASSAPVVRPRPILVDPADLVSCAGWPDRASSDRKGL